MPKKNSVCDRTDNTQQNRQINKAKTVKEQKRRQIGNGFI